VEDLTQNRIVCHDTLPGDGYFSAVGEDLAGDQVEQSSFARPISAEQPVDFIGRDSDADVIQCPGSPIPFVQVFNDYGHHGRLLLSQAW